MKNMQSKGYFCNTKLKKLDVKYECTLKNIITIPRYVEQKEALEKAGFICNERLKYYCYLFNGIEKVVIGDTKRKMMENAGYLCYTSKQPELLDCSRIPFQKCEKKGSTTVYTFKKCSKEYHTRRGYTCTVLW